MKIVFFGGQVETSAYRLKTRNGIELADQTEGMQVFGEKVNYYNDLGWFAPIQSLPCRIMEKGL